MNMKLPSRTVERLSKYRRLLDKYKDLDEAHIYSHKLEGLLNLTPEQVIQDKHIHNAILTVPPEIYLKDYDSITSLEEIGFFIKE